VTVPAPIDTGTDRMVAAVGDGIGWITFNNPERHNAVSLAMLRSVPPTLAAFQADPAVRVVVMTGAGEKAFVSGADISEFGERRTSIEARAEFDEVAGRAAAAWQALEKPIVAMIRGYCIGGGLGIALQADIRIAAEDSVFSIPAARLGLGYSMNAVEALVEHVGAAWAAEILFTARRLSAEEALRIGLVNHVVPAAELAAHVERMAGAIAANAPLTVHACKVALRELRRSPDTRDIDRAAALSEACFRSEDYLEGQRAFLEKRAPRFSGR
jgi:enoyl-CoA hydratase/carnithine racemase